MAVCPDQRRALARRVGVGEAIADDLSRWVLGAPEDFDADSIRSWRIGSARWLTLVDAHVGPLADRVARPVALFVAPARNDDAWCLDPVLSLDMIRLVHELGGSVDRSLCAATVPVEAAPALLERVNPKTWLAGKRTEAQTVAELSAALSAAFATDVKATSLLDGVEKWGRLHVTRQSWKQRSLIGGESHQLQITVTTTPTKGFGIKRVGQARREHTASVPMALGEAVSVAVDCDLPLLLSSEAAGKLADTVQVGRMKGRPGIVTVTTSDGVSASTERVASTQLVARLRALRDSGQAVVLDSGARMIARMVTAKSLTSDPILLGRQREVAAIMAVGSGVNASQTGCGKTITTARALYHRAATTAGFRGALALPDRLVAQWDAELTVGAPERGMPALLPNAAVRVLRDRGSIAAQIRAFHVQCGDGAGVLLVPNSVLDRVPGDLATLHWHVLIVEEGLRYVHPKTEAHQALMYLRMKAVADCWVLTATPRGKDRRDLDSIVGIAVGDTSMIAEHVATSEAGDLLDPINGERLRRDYGPTMLRITRRDMKAHLPDVRAAQPIAVEADPALQELLYAIRTGGQAAYEALLVALEALKCSEEHSGAYYAALGEVRRCQGLVLGLVGVFVDASIDPATLKHSRSTLAQALVHQGLVDAAMVGGGNGLPTLRGVVADALAAIVADQQVLVFADHVRCLHQLCGTLRDRHGVRAHVADGSLKLREFDELKARFQGGEFEVLLLSSVGQEGHNLQMASTLFHLDLGWVPGGLEQRVGRSARPGNPHGFVDTVIAYIKGGGVEHQVKVLSERGGEHHLVLDAPEGVDASESTIATQLAQITAQVADSKEEAGFAYTAARMRVAAAVFGAGHAT